MYVYSQIYTIFEHKNSPESLHQENKFNQLHLFHFCLKVGTRTRVYSKILGCFDGKQMKESKSNRILCSGKTIGQLVKLNILI